MGNWETCKEIIYFLQFEDYILSAKDMQIAMENMSLCSKEKW